MAKIKYDRIIPTAKALVKNAPTKYIIMLHDYEKHLKDALYSLMDNDKINGYKRIKDEVRRDIAFIEKEIEISEKYKVIIDGYEPSENFKNNIQIFHKKMLEKKTRLKKYLLRLDETIEVAIEEQKKRKD